MSGEVLEVPARFNGPPAVANGGYLAGRLASYLGGAAEVTLRRPTQLARPLHIRRPAEGRLELLDGEMLLAEAALADCEIAIPRAVGFAEAEAASRNYLGFAGGGISGCFVCGAARPDGLRIFAGPLGDGVVAAPWQPGRELDDGTGHARPEFVWAALDCPGAFALMGGMRRMMLLGRLAGRVETAPRIGERCVVLAWAIEGAGRKLLAGSAVLGEAGAVIARGRATWFATRPIVG